MVVLRLATASQAGPWWNVLLDGEYTIEEIRIYNRQDCCPERLDMFLVDIYFQGDVVWTYDAMYGIPPYETILPVPSIAGDKVQVRLPDGITEILSLAEVEVYSIVSP